jgi:hypothetical protein
MCVCACECVEYVCTCICVPHISYFEVFGLIFTKISVNITSKTAITKSCFLIPDSQYQQHGGIAKICGKSEKK